MFLTRVLQAKAKAKYILVSLKSTASDHFYCVIRDRFLEKIECVKFDPIVQDKVLYVEGKKIRSMYNYQPKKTRKPQPCLTEL
ncbi:unnamed protein product [Cyprideis torosa]|uniref:Large ribosomal subunit protein bL33m n=1 Tax=Cyprideis torosa TaxID=163714 RepID=A0A7R8ZQ76_9CRUS|nr:unnamed protein product [Cyprideis torosa]CAG0895652.1 unnamed protein product [Cyprideis torosa]